MFVIVAVLLGGIFAGRLLRGRRLASLPRLITGIIWVLLFLLGIEVGADPTVVGGLASLGVAAFVLFGCSVAGSVAVAWLLWRWVRRRGHTAAEKAEGEHSGDAASSAAALRGSLVIVAFFVIGCLAGVLTGLDLTDWRVSTWVLYVLMFSVGMSLGHDATLVGRIRQLDPRLALLPLATAVGTLGGSACAAALVPWSVGDTLAVGAGFGYYSLSSIFIADLRGPELATIALLCNILRELFTLLAAPLVARWFGPLAAVSIGGATTFDTTLPVITRAAGAPYAVVSIFHGCMLDFSVPFLVPFFCAL